MSDRETVEPPSNQEEQQQLAGVGSLPQPPNRALSLHNVAVLVSGAAQTPVCVAVYFLAGF